MFCSTFYSFDTSVRNQSYIHTKHWKGLFWGLWGLGIFFFFSSLLLVFNFLFFPFLLYCFAAPAVACPGNSQSYTIHWFVRNLMFNISLNFSREMRQFDKIPVICKTWGAALKYTGCRLSWLPDLLPPCLKCFSTIKLDSNNAFAPQSAIEI